MYRYHPGITDVARLGHRTGPSDYGESHHAELGIALAGLLKAVREARPVKVSIGPLGHPYQQAAISWREHAHGDTWSHVISNCESYQAFLNPYLGRRNEWLTSQGVAVGDGNLLDKLLTALIEGWQVGAYRAEGLAILAIDRQSHGNHPAVTLDQENWVTFYHDIPEPLWRQFRPCPYMEPSDSDALFTRIKPLSVEGRASAEGYRRGLHRREKAFLDRIGLLEEAGERPDPAPLSAPWDKGHGPHTRNADTPP